MADINSDLGRNSRRQTSHWESAQRVIGMVKWDKQDNGFCTTMPPPSQPVGPRRLPDPSRHGPGLLGATGCWASQLRNTRLNKRQRHHLLMWQDATMTKRRATLKSVAVILQMSGVEGSVESILLCFKRQIRGKPDVIWEGYFVISISLFFFHSPPKKTLLNLSD